MSLPQSQCRARCKAIRQLNQHTCNPNLLFFATPSILIITFTSVALCLLHYDLCIIVGGMDYEVFADLLVFSEAGVQVSQSNLMSGLQ